MVTHDIKDVYVNISIRETIEITKKLHKKEWQTNNRPDNHNTKNYPRTELFLISRFIIPKED